VAHGFSSFCYGQRQHCPIRSTFPTLNACGTQSRTKRPALQRDASLSRVQMPGGERAHEQRGQVEKPSIQALHGLLAGAAAGLNPQCNTARSTPAGTQAVACPLCRRRLLARRLFERMQSSRKRSRRHAFASNGRPPRAARSRRHERPDRTSYHGPNRLQSSASRWASFWLSRMWPLSPHHGNTGPASPGEERAEFIVPHKRSA
jgi:hypothetical protein